jgi:predicted N-acetyltransferase YhbS
VRPQPTIVIRPENPHDAPRVRAINQAAFNGSEEARIVDAMRVGDDWLDGGSLVADVGSELVGHILLSRGALIGARREWILGMIGPIAVVPPMQGRGIGAALMRAAIVRAESLGLPALCLLGHADYYPRFGFRRARELGIEAPQPWPDDSWMALPLATWKPEMRGVARYPAAFGIG